MVGTVVTALLALVYVTFILKGWLSFDLARQG
jgi:hypothetical protein